MTGFLRPDQGLLAEQLLLFFEQSPQPMLLVDPERFVIARANNAAADLYGYAVSQLAGMALSTLRPPDELPHLRRHLHPEAPGPYRPAGPNPDGTWRHLKAGGGDLFVEVVVTPLEVEGRRLNLVQVEDVTRHLQTSLDLQRRDKLLDATAFAATQLLATPCLASSLPAVLGRIGSSSEVDRVYVFECVGVDEAGPRVSQRYEWAANGVSVEIDNPDLQNLSFSDFGIEDWSDALVDHQSVQVMTADLPDAARTLMEEQQITMLTLVPIFAGDCWWGFIGFDLCGPPRSWSASELRVLETLADLIGAAVKRQADDSALRASEHRYRALLEAANDAIFIADFETGRFLDANPKGLELTGLPLAQLCRLRVDAIHPPDQRESILDGFFSQSEEKTRSIIGDIRPLTVLRPDGSEVPVSISSSLIEIGKQRLKLGIFRDATQQREHEQGLREAKERAEEISRLKSAFLANMSHEIRTPLTSIIGYADLLIEEAEGELGDYAGLIHQSGQRLLETLNSVLDLAQLEGGSFSVERTPLVAESLIHETLTLFEARAGAKGLSLTYASSGIAPRRVLADRAALHRVLANLVSNAIKFTASGSVKLSLETQEDTAVFTVADTGIGIDAAFLPSLFDEFRQESSGEGRTHEGNGLGLAITRRLVELMDGRLSVTSEKGVGSTFVLRLPLAPPGQVSHQTLGGRSEPARSSR